MKGTLKKEFLLSGRLDHQLNILKERDLYRSLRVLASTPDSHVTIEGASFVNFSSNNYLGWATDDRLKKVAVDSLTHWGVGSTASRLLGGTLDVHTQLEKSLAAFKKMGACAVFSSGYHANLGTLPSLLDSGDTVILDRYAHASLVDGARLSKATLRVFKHNDVDDLEKVLRKTSPEGQRWVVTESLFSMDGDVAPLCEIVYLAKQYNARLYVDEAHSTGVFGPEGRGIINGLGLEKKIDVSMGTFSKAFGGLGGYICSSQKIIEWIHNKNRSFIYSTALSPVHAAVALKAIALSQTDSSARKKVLALAAQFRKALFDLSGKKGVESIKSPYFRYEEGPIIPFLVGSEKSALSLSSDLWKNKIFAPAIRPPTVPKGTSRIRFSLTAHHTSEDIEKTLSVIKKWNQK